ncbi:MAG: hypothetical protein EPN97_14525 [Alphaproteobacteria bacterium]|nr:MAG: hypothetical protein EPN97_14525 [Alphaproteobacteria bacterium]
MGKVFIEFGIPLIVILFAAWFIVKKWFIKVLPLHVKTAQEIDKAAHKVDTELAPKKKPVDPTHD